jgi:hypothetical protein
MRLTATRVRVTGSPERPAGFLKTRRSAVAERLRNGSSLVIQKDVGLHLRISRLSRTRRFSPHVTTGEFEHCCCNSFEACASIWRSTCVSDGGWVVKRAGSEDAKSVADAERAAGQHKLSAAMLLVTLLLLGLSLALAPSEWAPSCVIASIIVPGVIFWIVEKYGDRFG